MHGGAKNGLWSDPSPWHRIGWQWRTRLSLANPKYCKSLQIQAIRSIVRTTMFLVASTSRLLLTISTFLVDFYY
jgi:hypothetical protein